MWSRINDCRPYEESKLLNTWISWKYINNCYIFHVHHYLYIQQRDLVLIAISDIERFWNSWI